MNSKRTALQLSVLHHVTLPRNGTVSSVAQLKISRLRLSVLLIASSSLTHTVIMRIMNTRTKLNIRDTRENGALRLVVRATNSILRIWLAISIWNKRHLNDGSILLSMHLRLPTRSKRILPRRYRPQNVIVATRISWRVTTALCHNVSIRTNSTADEPHNVITVATSSSYKAMMRLHRAQHGSACRTLLPILIVRRCQYLLPLYIRLHRRNVNLFDRLLIRIFPLNIMNISLLNLLRNNIMIALRRRISTQHTILSASQDVSPQASLRRCVFR